MVCKKGDRSYLTERRTFQAPNFCVAFIYYFQNQNQLYWPSLHMTNREFDSGCAPLCSYVTDTNRKTIRKKKKERNNDHVQRAMNNVQKKNIYKIK